MKTIFNFIFTNENEDGDNLEIGYAFAEEEFQDYILNAYNWSDEDFDTIKELFHNDEFDSMEYIYINCNLNIMIDDERLIEEIHKFCDKFMDEENIERLIEIMGICD